MRENVFQIAKAVLAALLFSLAFVLLFSLIIQIFSLPINAVKPINQVFKIIIIALAGVLFLGGEKGIIKGLIYGAVAVTFTYFTFSFIAGTVNFSYKFILELLLGSVAGAISGIIAVNIKKRQ
ncbi:MAG: TIGR04086 family membrane protein [Clostridia bacterium]|nr:TIGR04086 family membrane protein [Clostridia bacterium]